MRTYCFVLFCFFIFTGRLVSQSSEYSGGYGHFFTGPGWIEPNGLIDHLRSPQVFGPSFNWHTSGIMTGAEGFAEIHRLLIGGGGFGLVLPNMEADSGIVRSDFGGGYVKVGYVLHQTQRYFLSAHAGFGGGALYVGIENNSSTPVFFSSNRPVLAGRDEDYFIGYLLYDIGIDNKFIATRIDPNNRRSGGFMLGLDIGALIGVPVDNWRDENGTITGIPSPGSIFSPYLHLTIGGGGFKNKSVTQ